jgi:hypothetical protein
MPRKMPRRFSVGIFSFFWWFFGILFATWPEGNKRDAKGPKGFLFN